MDRRVQSILRLLDSNDAYLQALRPLDDLAERINLSGSRLRHIFKAETGLTLAHFLLVLRLERAKQLLETTDLSVKEVMGQIRMSNESWFVQAFRNAYGVTPGYYRTHAVTTRPEIPRRPGRSQKTT